MTQLEMFEDEEPTKPRIPLEFVGTTSAAFSADPKEYRGMTMPQITQAILKTLSEIAPGVDFFEQDVVMAADAIHSAL